MNIKVKIGPKRTRFLNLTEELRKQFDAELSYSKPGAFFAKGRRRGGWDGRTHLMFRDGVSTGLFLAMKDTLKEKYGVKFLVKYELEPLARTDDNTRSDREFQNETVDAMLAAKWGGLVLNTTGSGKTYIAGLFCRKVDEGVVFIVDELTLLAQTREELARVIGEPVGIIGKSEWEPERVTVATIQTLHSQKNSRRKGQGTRYANWAKTVGVSIVDEIHLAINKRNFRVVESLKPKRRYGLTATLQLNHKHVRLRAYQQCGPVLYSYSLQDGVAEGYLSKGLVVMADTESDGVPNTFDHHAMYESFIVDNRQRNKKIADIARAAHEAGHAVVVICDRPKHVRKLSRLLNDITHRVAYGAISSAERIKACRQFDAGLIRLLIVNRVFKKGINLKRISFIVECSGLKDPNDTLQKFGRGVRLSPDKDGLIYVDIRDLVSGVGMAYGHIHPYTEAGDLRRKAYKGAGIKVLRAKADLPAHRLVRNAERALNTEVRDKNKRVCYDIFRGG